MSSNNAVVMNGPSVSLNIPGTKVKFFLEKERLFGWDLEMLSCPIAHVGLVF